MLAEPLPLITTSDPTCYTSSRKISLPNQSSFFSRLVWVDVQFLAHSSLRLRSFFLS